jgi:hypothetical protein
VTAVTLGDLLDRATTSLSDASGLRDLPSSTVVAASIRLRRVVTALSRYVDEPRAYPDPAAATHAQVRLFQAAASLARAAQAGAGVQGPGAAHPFAARIGTGAPALIAGLDMLATHYTEDADGLVHPRSPWADVLATGATRTALLAEIADVAATAGSACHAMAGLPAPALPDASRDALRAAAAQLSAILPTPCGETDYRQLVRAVPAAMLPSRGPAGQPENIVGLHDQIAASAARIRTRTWRNPGSYMWPPPATLGTWRWHARACAITGRISEQILAGLAERSPALGQAGLRPALEHAAIAAGTAWSSWRQTASTAALLTESLPWAAPDPIRDDLTDMMIRLGRIAYSSPRWTPAASDHAPLKDPPELAPQADDLRVVLSAVQHAADALDRVAAADLASARAASPGQTYQSATPDRFPVTMSDLLDLYEMTSQATGRAARAIDAPSVTADTPAAFLPVMRRVLQVTANGQAGAQDQQIYRPLAATRRRNMGPDAKAALWRASFPGQPLPTGLATDPPRPASPPVPSSAQARQTTAY